MPRRAKGLTALSLKVSKPGRYGDGNGLYLLVRSAEARFWVFRYTRDGRMREMGLGRAGVERGAVTLAEARDKAAVLHALVRNGTDPLAQRETEVAAKKAAAQVAAIKAITFHTAADQYIAAHEPGWRNAKHAQQWRNTLATYAHPIFGDVPVGTIETSHVLAALEPIWREKPETAVRLRGRIESILDYARARGWRAGENPARWRGHLSQTLPPRSKIAPVQHHPALPWKEMGTFLTQLRQERGVAARALEFAILTAARSGEVRGARWKEVNLREKTWTIPATRMKAGKEHRVPLSDAAIKLLRDISADATPKPDASIFKPTRSEKLSEMALTMVLRRMNRADLTVHGFRSSFRDWVSEATAYAREVAEAALAHTLDDKVEAAYRRGDLFEKRRDLMREWSAYCNAGFTGRQVVALRETA